NLMAVGDVPDKDLISFTDEGAAATIDPAEAQKRAEKAHIAMGEDSPGVAMLLQEFQSGLENRVRERAALAEDIRQRKVRMEMIQEIINQSAAKGEVPTGESQDRIMSLTSAEATDPSTVLEIGYAKKVVQGIPVASGEDNDNTLDEALAEDPEATYQTLDSAEAVFTRQEIVNNLLGALSAKYKQQSWRRWGVETGKTLFPLISWWNLSSATEEYGGGSTYLGTSLERAVESLYLLPPNEFKERVTHIADTLAATNLQDALRFAGALAHYSNSDAIWDDAMSIVDATSVIPGGMAARAAQLKRGMKGVKGAADLEK